MKRLVLGALAFTCVAAVAGVFGRNDFKVSDDPFSADDLVSGLRATKAQCVGDELVWAEAGGEAECIRYYHADFSEGKYAGKGLFGLDPIPRTGLRLILKRSRVQGYPRRRSALATNRPTRWVTRVPWRDRCSRAVSPRIEWVRDSPVPSANGAGCTSLRSM
jgi:hypothetical protein